MDTMVNQKKVSKYTKSGIVCIFLYLVVCVDSFAGKLLGFELKKSLALQQMYSDNLGYANPLLSSGAQSGFVTIVEPSLSIKKDTARIKFNFMSRYQLIGYEGIDKGTRIYPQIQLNSKVELYQDKFFLDTTALVAQGNINSLGTVSSTNVSVGNSNYNSGTYSTFRISPYWIVHADNMMKGEIRLGYYRFDRGGTSGISIPNISTSSNNAMNSYYQSMYLTNGSHFDSLGVPWRFNGNNQNMEYDDSANKGVRFTSINGEVNYNLTKYYGLFFQTGYYDNDYGIDVTASAGRVRPHNGFYFVPGIIWKPVRYFSVAAGWGLNSRFTTINFNPSMNTTLMINYRFSDVGGSNCGNPGLSSSIGGLGGYSMGSGGCSTSLGLAGGSSGFSGSGYSPSMYGGTGGINSNFPTGPLGITNAGSIWNVSLNHRRKKTQLTASYFTTVTTLQNILSSVPTFASTFDQFGDSLDDPIALNRNLSIGNFTNAVMTNSRATASFSWFMNRNSLHLNAYYAHITYSNSTRGQDIYGLNGSIRHTINESSSVSLAGTWNTADYGSSGLQTTSLTNTFLTISLSYNRNFTRSIRGNLIYSYYQGGNPQFTGLNTDTTFNNNRVVAAITYSF